MTIDAGIPANDRRERFIASGGQTLFPFDFPVFDATDLRVTRLRGTAQDVLALGADYAVTGAGQDGGGSITLTTGAVAGDIVVIESAMPIGRAAQFVNGGPLAATALETEFNRGIIALQQAARDQGRTVRLPVTDAGDLVLPPASDRAGRVQGFSGDGLAVQMFDLPAVPQNSPGIFWCGTAAGTANALLLTATPVPTAYVDGQTWVFVAASNNTAAVTINVNGLGVVDLRDASGNALGSNALVAGRVYVATGRISGAFRLTGQSASRDVPVIPLTSTGTYATAYTGSTTTALAEGEFGIVIPDRNGDALATLSINAGPAYQMRHFDGGVVARGDVEGGTAYPVIRRSNLYWMLTSPSQHNLTNRIQIARSGGSSLDWKELFEDVFHRARVFLGPNGVDLAAGGTGAANDAVTVARAQADGDLRVFNRLLIGTPAYQAHTDTNPPSYIDDVAAALLQVPVVFGRDNRDVTVVDSAEVYLVSTDRWIRVVGTNRYLDFSTLQVNSVVRVEVQPSASAAFYAEQNWKGAGAQQLAAAADTSYLVVRTQVGIYCQQVPAFVTTSGAGAPTRTMKVGWMPAQSWGVHAEQDIWEGFQAELKRLAVPQSIWVVQGLAAGASSLLRSNDSNPWSNNWWHDTSVVAGPLLTAANTTMTNPATRGPIPPSMSALFSYLGLNDAKLSTSGVGMDDTGATTIATWTTAHQAVQASVRSVVGPPNLPFFVLPLPNQEATTFVANSITALRIAAINVVAGTANTFRGPDTYDLWRTGTARHLTYVAARELGRRLARFYAAALLGVSGLLLGPRIVGAARINARQFRVTILRGPGGIGGGNTMRRPLRPVGFGLLPPGTAYVSGAQAARYEISRFAWGDDGTNDLLDIYTAADTDGSGAGPRLVYPDGFMAEARHAGRVIATDDGFGPLPLQTHLPGNYTV
jgi:hypothetical protein